MGVVTYFLLAGYTPFDRDTQQLEMQAIIAGDYKFEPVEYWENVSQTAKDFVSYCLTLDPAERPTAEEVLEHKVRWLYSSLPDKAFRTYCLIIFPLRGEVVVGKQDATLRTRE